jgi:hypothetical protein
MPASCAWCVEIGDAAHAPHDHLPAAGPDEFDHETGEAPDLDVGTPSARASRAIATRSSTLKMGRLESLSATPRMALEQTGRTADDLLMAARERIECPG